MKTRQLLVLLMAALLVMTGGCKAKADESSYKDDKYKAGQVWSYKTRPNEDKSTIKILKVENYQEQGAVIHIAVDSLHIKDKEGKEHDSIGHLPYSKAALDESVTALLKENQPIPDFKEGYDKWKAAFDAKGAGIWTVPVADAVGYMEVVMNK